MNSRNSSTPENTIVIIFIIVKLLSLHDFLPFVFHVILYVCVGFSEICLTHLYKFGAWIYSLENYSQQDYIRTLIVEKETLVIARKLMSSTSGEKCLVCVTKLLVASLSSIHNQLLIKCASPKLLIASMHIVFVNNHQLNLMTCVC